MGGLKGKSCKTKNIGFDGNREGWGDVLDCNRQPWCFFCKGGGEMQLCIDCGTQKEKKINFIPTQTPLFSSNKVTCRKSEKLLFPIKLPWIKQCCLWCKKKKGKKFFLPYHTPISSPSQPKGKNGKIKVSHWKQEKKIFKSWKS